MATSISTTLEACLKAFDRLIEQAKKPDCRHDEEVSLDFWTDESKRLRDWASKAEAQQTGQASLESRLEDPSHLFFREGTKSQVTKLLTGLNLILTKTAEKLSEAGSSASGDGAASDTSPELTTALQRLDELVVDIIDCLNDLSPFFPKVDHAVFDNTSKGSLEEIDENPVTTLAREPDSQSANPLGPRADHGQEGIVASEELGHDGHRGNGREEEGPGKTSRGLRKVCSRIGGRVQELYHMLRQ